MSVCLCGCLCSTTKRAVWPRAGSGLSFNKYKLLSERMATVCLPDSLIYTIHIFPLFSKITPHYLCVLYADAKRSLAQNFASRPAHTKVPNAQPYWGSELAHIYGKKYWSSGS